MDNTQTTKQRVAVFDIDGTLFRSSLLIELVDVLIQEEVFPQDSKLDFVESYTAWLNREGSYEDYIGAVIKTFIENLKGVHYSKLVEASDIVLLEQKRRVYRYTRDLLEELRRDGYFLLAISQSPKTILDRFAPAFGFDKVYGRIYPIGPGDLFTGEVAEEHLIANKANIVRRAVEKENLTLSGSVGVGDTEGDISFLELVEQPIAFNPNKALFRHAKLNAWKVVVERKDMVYEFDEKGCL